MRLSKRDEHFLDVALKAAENSEYRQKHGAVITKNGNILAIGINKARNHPRVLGDFIKTNASFHAEMVAKSRVSDQNLQGATIYVARVMNDGQPSLSKPCPDCQRELDRVGVKRVVYTT